MESRGRVAALAGAAALVLVGAACGSSATKSSSAPPGNAGTAAASPGAPAPDVTVGRDAKYGQFLTTPAGFALYVYTADLAGGPGCDTRCLAVWPPLLLPAGTTTPVAAAGATGLGTVARGGRLEVTYQGLPLYTFVKDKQPGDVKGQDVVDSGGKWILATVPPPSVERPPL